MVQVERLELSTARVSDEYSNQTELHLHMVEMTRLELVSKNQLLIRNLILTLQVLCIPFYLYSLPYTNLKSKSMQISKSLKAAGIDS